MAHALVHSNYKRNGRDEVLVFDAGEGKQVHLHPGMNALPAELWDIAKRDERAKALLAQAALVDKGLAPELADDAAPPAPASAPTAAAPALDVPAIDEHA
jgi:hypothetical protein